MNITEQPVFTLKPSVICIRRIIFLSLTTVTSIVNAAESQDNIQVLPTITVVAEEEKVAYKSGNMDLARTEDDVQPYKFIERKDIENSGATSVAELLQKLLPQSTSTSPDIGANFNFNGNSSMINLRGLGASQTLVLINGRRAAGIGSRGTSESTDQPNINNIPLAAIERIEILPNSASAIYGSGALGGVVNVVLRRDYVGNEVNIRYGSNFDGNAATKTVNFTGGFALEDGLTNVLISAQKQDSDALLRRDSDYPNRGRERLVRNNPNTIYGSNRGVPVDPPSGDLVNIRTADGSSLFGNGGSSFAYIPKGFQGSTNINDWKNALQGTLGKYALGQAPGIADFSGDKALIPDMESESVNISINRDFTDKLNIFVEAAYDKTETDGVGDYYGGTGAKLIRANAPNNPFGKDILVNAPSTVTGPFSHSRSETEGKRAALGFTYDITPKWVVAGDYSWSESSVYMIYPRYYGSRNEDKLLDDINNGTVDLLRDTTSYMTDTISYTGYNPTLTTQKIQDYNLRANGSLWNWYAGDMRLATGLEHRIIKSEGHGEFAGATKTFREQNTSALYAEVTVPFISPEMNLPFAKLLEVHAAGRHERFDVKTAGTKLDKTTPAFGFRFAPNDSVMLRASYAEGFIPPTVSQISQPTPSATTTEITDPLRNNEKYHVQTVGGGNPDLTPETAESLNVGLVLTPEFIKNLRLSFDYYQIEKDNNITSLSAQQILNDGDTYADRVTRDSTGRVTSIYTAPTNALSLKTSGIDTALAYDFDSILGNLAFNLGYTRVLEFKQQPALNTPERDNVNIPSRSQAPLKHRANASAYLQATDAWGFGWNTQYYGSYQLDIQASGRGANPLIAVEQGSDTINRQIYHDVFARAKLFPDLAKKANLDNAEFTFGIKNLLNDKQIDMSNAGNYFSSFADPRGRQYFLNLKFNF